MVGQGGCADFAEIALAASLDEDITELGTDKIIEGEAVVADMPLVDLSDSGAEAEFSELEPEADPETVVDAEVTELKEV